MLEIDEVQAKVEEIEEDMKFERIFNDAKEKHHQLMTGILYMYLWFCLLMSRVLNILCMKFNRLNVINVRGKWEGLIIKTKYI